MNRLERHVADLGRALHGPRRAKRDLLREVHDHLVDATEALEERGMARADAEARAVREFGPVDVVAPGYQTVLAAGHVRRTAVLLALVTLVQPVAWGVLTDDAAAAPAGSAQHVLNGVVEAMGNVAFAAALALVLLTGVGTRFLGIRRGLLRTGAGAAVALSGCIVAMGIAMAATATGSVWATALQATVVTLVPYGLLAGDGVRCLRAVS